MKKLIAGVVAALMIPFAAHAQDGAAPPDGSTAALALEPYVAIMGGYHDFDNDNRGPLTTNCGTGGCPNGAFIEAIAGINIPLGAFFVGAEGNIAKGFSDLDWEYGVSGRVGFRAGESGLVYAKAGWQWVNVDAPAGIDNDDDDMAWGLGVEVGPEDVGLSGIGGVGTGGVRLRLEASTFDFQSIRPSAGLVLHF